MTPNIIVYFTDQQRPDTIGCYGQKLPVTPNLDALARQGVRFEHAFTCQPVCGPARACLQTGKYATQTGCYTNGRALDPREDTIARRLGGAGYETAYVGKWHLASSRPQGLVYATSPIPEERRGGYKDYIAMADVLEFTSHGYDGYVYDKDNKRMDFIGYRADCLTDYAIHYIRNKTSAAPFFLFISHIEPHQQNDRNCYEGPDGSKTRFKDYDVPADLLVGQYEGDWKTNYPDYLGCCSSLDYNLGRLIDTLKAKGIYENTVIMFTSDHGNHFKTREGEYKRQCFDSCLRIPLIISGGPFRGGRTFTELVSLINLPPTILKLAGLDIPPHMPEAPLTDVLEGGEDWQDSVFYQISEAELARGIRTKRWKYCVHAPHRQALLRMDDKFNAQQYHGMLATALMDSDSYVEQHLYDLVNDPTESKNLVNDPGHLELRGQLSKKLIERMLKAGEKAPRIFPAGHVFPA